MRKIVTLVTAVAVLTVPSGVAVNAYEADRCGGPDVRVEASRLERRTPPEACDLRGRIITDHGAAVHVPPPGRWAMANLTTVDGPQSLRVATEADGTVVVDFVGDETATGEASSLDTPADGPMQAAEDVSSGDTPAFSDDVAMDVADGLRAYTVAPDPGGQYHQECADDPNNDLGFEDNTNFIWYIRTSTIPTEQGISRAAVIADLRQGYDNWEQSRNICGWPDQIDARNRYGGGRDIPSRIGTRGECTGSDGVYMVDFGALPPDKLGVNCTYGTADGESNEADIKLNRWDRSWFTGEIPAGCSDLDSIENIMTHEAGHTYGLGDYYWQGAKYMTMHGYLFPCDRRAVTLGWGDYKLARQKY